MLTSFTWPLRPRVTLADVLPHGPAAAPLSSVAEPQFAFTCLEARFSSISTESLSYGVFDPDGADAAVESALPLEVLPLLLDDVDALSFDPLPPVGDGVSSDAWLPDSGGTQSEPLSTVPSGQLPGASAPSPPRRIRRDRRDRGNPPRRTRPPSRAIHSLFARSCRA